MGTTTLLVLRDRLAKMVEGSDYIEVDVTTEINPDTSIVSTNLQSYDHGSDGYFDNWWVYITTFDNAGTFRKIPDYDTVTGTISIRGASLNDDNTDTATIRLTRIDPTLYLNALNESIREIYPNVLGHKDDLTLITGNLLPNAHFEDQPTAGTPTKWSLYTITGTAETAIIRGGSKSVKLTRTEGDGWLKCSVGQVATDYRRLLDLMGKTVDFKCWCYTDTASQAYIEIYTEQADGTTQTLTSSAHSGNQEYELLELENQVLNDDLTDIEFRLKVITSAGNVWFDDARVTGSFYPREYRLPTDFQAGSVRRVDIQTTGYSDDICDDIRPQHFEEVYGFTIVEDGTDAFLRLPAQYTSNKRIWLRGDYPMTVLSDDTDTIPIDELKPLNLFLTYAKYKLFESLTAAPDSQDITRYERAAAKALGEYYRMLPMARMSRTPSLLNIRRY